MKAVSIRGESPEEIVNKQDLLTAEGKAEFFNITSSLALLKEK